MAVLTMDAPGETTRYRLRITRALAEIRPAQRLRHLVMGEDFGVLPGSELAGHDVDEFDAHCDHLVVVARSTSEVIATCRLLPPARVAAAGQLSAASQFNLSALDPLRDSLVEVGRVCVHPAHRDSGVIDLMGASLVFYAHLHGYRWFGGGTSISVTDGGAAVASAWRRVSCRHLSPPPLRVVPRLPWLAETAPVPAGVSYRLPYWLRGCIRLGGWVCGSPAYNRHLNAADLFTLVSMDRIDPRYLDRCRGLAAA